MKTKKVFYLTKEFLEKEVGVNVIVGTKPISIINNFAVSAKGFVFNSLEELKQHDMFMNIKVMNSYCYLYDMDIDEYNDFGDGLGGIEEATEDEQMWIDEIKKEIVKTIYTNKYEDGMQLFGRFYTI